MPGSARSASVIDNPQVGQATQAIDQRRTVEISFVQLDAMLAQNLFDAARDRCRDIGEQHALMRRRAGCRAESVLQISRSAVFSCKSLLVVDAAVFHVQAIEPAAVALLVPAQVIVEAVHVVRDADRQARWP